MKNRGLALLVGAALLLAGFAAADGAAAKVCSTSGTGASCGAGHGNVYSGSLALSSSKATIASGFVTLTCTGSSMSGSVTNGETGLSKITSLTFSECTSGLGPCHVTTSHFPEFHWKPPFHWTKTGSTILEFTCSFGGSSTPCKYASSGTGTESEISGTGGEPATVTVTKLALSKQAGSSAFCSSTATWSGTYTVNTPNSLFVT